MSAPVIVGLDLSPTKCGWAAVCDHEEWRPIVARSSALDGSPEAVRALVDHFAPMLAGGEPVLCLMEHNHQVSKHAAFRQGEAVGLMTATLRRRWPGLVIDRVNVESWRSEVGLLTWEHPAEGRARRRSRDELKAASLELATALGFAVGTDDDAAEAALIARAGWLRLQRGEIGRVA